jgi:uncharacterized protein (DUF1810 family)
MSLPADPFDLQRFVSAQRGVFDRVLAELRQGRKTSHWMWFVFPQIAGLGHSETSVRYAISTVDEAIAYWRHDILGPRLRACIEALLTHPGLSALQIMGSPDDRKLRSSLTLFAQAIPDEPLFAEALRRFFDGRPDPETLARLQ